MGKRKSMRSKVAPRKKAAEKMETAFCCPFCNHSGSVECSIDLKHMVAEATCFVCKESYSTVPHAVTEPIGVYNEWIDECERSNERVDRRDTYTYDGDQDDASFMRES